MKTLYVIAASVVLAASSAAFAETSGNAGYAPRADIEDPAWVKQLDAEREARMNERPAFGEMPEFADAPAFETPEWVKQLDAEREARMNERPAFGEMPEFDAAELEAPDFTEMDESLAQFIKESDERHAQFIKESDERRAASKKAFEERRAASKQRHEEFMKKFNKVGTEEAVEEAAVEKQS